MPLKKQEFTIKKDDLIKAIDVDDTEGRTVPINMNFVDESSLEKDSGYELIGTVPSVIAHSLFNYKKKDGTEFFLRMEGTSIQDYDSGTDTWSDLKRGDFTITIASPAVVTLTDHGFKEDSPVRFETTGALPTGVTAGTTYYVIATGLTSSAFQFSATVGGSAINTSGTQSGTHSVYGVYTAGAEVGYIVYDDELFFGNAVENFTKFDGTDFTEYDTLPKGNIYEVFEDRLFVTGVIAEPLTVYYSNTGVPTTFTGSDIVNPLGTDHCTGLINFFGQLLIFKENSIWKFTFVYDQVAAAFVPKLESQNRNYGAVDRKVITWVENDVWFFNGKEVRSIGFQDKQIGVLGVNKSVISEPIKETLQTVAIANYAVCSAFYYERRYYLSVPINISTNDTTFVCHLLYGNNWTKYTGRDKARIKDAIVIDDVIYSANDSSPFGVNQWIDQINDTSTSDIIKEDFDTDPELGSWLVGSGWQWNSTNDNMETV